MIICFRTTTNVAAVLFTVSDNCNVFSIIIIGLFVESLWQFFIDVQAQTIYQLFSVDLSLNQKINLNQYLNLNLNLNLNRIRNCQPPVSYDSPVTPIYE